MISHVLGKGKGQGYPVGSKMPGAFDSIRAMLTAFVRDYKPRSSPVEHGKTPDPELMLLVFTDKEISRMKEETGKKVTMNAVREMVDTINQELDLFRGFRQIQFDIDGDIRPNWIGMVFCPNNMDWPADLGDLETGPTKDENLNPISYKIWDY